MATFDRSSDDQIIGRVLYAHSGFSRVHDISLFSLRFNVWRVMRSELHEMSFTFENSMWVVCTQRVPAFTQRALAIWWLSSLNRPRVVKHWLDRVHGNLKLLSTLDVVGRSAELARLYGFDVWRVLSRGSQYVRSTDCTALVYAPF